MKKLKLLILRIQLTIQILQIQLAIKLLRQKRTVPNLDAPTKIIIHHGGGWMDFAGVNAYHKAKWGFKSSLGYYAGYTIFIERDGRVFRARADNEEGAHTKGHNQRTIGIGLMGNGVDRDFTPQQYKALKAMVDDRSDKYNIPKSEIYGHRNFTPTICPSDPLYNWMLNYKGR